MPLYLADRALTHGQKEMTYNNNGFACPERGMDGMMLDANGAKVYVEQLGEKGDQVLLLHGWGCTVKHFEPIMADLRSGFRLTVLDFPGHGQSSKPPVPWGVSDYATCVMDVMGQLGIEKCHIIAHSFGGRVALQMAAYHPEKVDKMILTGGAGLKKPQTEEQKKRSAAYQKKKKTLQGLEKLPFFGKMAEKAMEKLRKQYGSADYNALDADMRQTFVKVISEDLSHLLPKIQASTLLVWGEKDQDTPLWMGQKMEKEIPDAGLVIFENDDHFAYLRQWPRFVKVIRAFL